MKTISLIENCPLTLLEVSDITDVSKRLSYLAKWKENYENNIHELYGRTTQLDIYNDPLDLQTLTIILNELKKMELKKVIQPLFLDEDYEKKFEKLRNILEPQYKNLSREEKILWLNNIEFFITPDLLKVLERISINSTHHLLVGGKSRMGKSTFFRWLATQMEPQNKGKYTYVPFVHVEGTTDLRSLKPFYQRLMLHYGGKYNIKPRGTEYEFQEACNGLMTITRARFVVIDEIGTMAINIIQRKLIEFSNLAPPDLKIIGTSVDPKVFTDGDDEILGRFGEPYLLKEFTGKNLENLLYFFDLILPFEKALLHTTKFKVKGKSITGLCQLIGERTGGILGDIVDLIKHSAIRVIEDSDKDRISATIIDDTWKKLHNIS